MQVAKIKVYKFFCRFDRRQKDIYVYNKKYITQCL